MTGVLTSDFIAPWAGVAFSPGTTPLQPANISSARKIRFWVRGEGKSFCVMGFSRAGGRAPSVRPITVGPDWAEVSVNLADLRGFDPSGATLLLIAANQAAGAFRLEIADVRLTAE